MAGGQQLRLLLWKDYLIRKRKLITLTGILWASSIMFSLYVVRININNQDFPTCGFPARVLPSAGMMSFLQSFMCTVDNECSPLDKFNEIPTYENSKLTQLQRKLAPMFNDSVLDVVLTVPNAIKLLATLADVVDEPAFIDISRNGLKVKDLFASPRRVRRYVSDQLNLDDEVTESFMDADISFQGILDGNVDRCSISSLKQTLMVENNEHLKILVEKLCSMKMEDLQKIFIDILFQVDYSKYMTMLGDMYFKMSGDDRLNTLGDMLTAVLRMVRLQNFLPPELVSIFQGKEVDFSYIQLSLIPRLMDLFKPTFGDTQSYGIIKDFTDAFVIGLQYMDKILFRQRHSLMEASSSVGTMGLQAVSNVFHNAVDVFEEAMEEDSSIDTFSILTQIMNFVNKFLPKHTKHDVLFYSTLLAKLMESAYKVIDINMHIEQLTYNVTQRHPAVIGVLIGLSPNMVSKAFEALTDAERTQILTSKINSPGQMFCEVSKLQKFFVISELEAESLKKQLCTDAWKNYVADFVESFGVFEVKRNINNIASLLIQETLGKDTSNQLYTIEQDFMILKNFSQALARIDTEKRPEVDWGSLFQVNEESEFMQVVRTHGHLGKQMLIVIHGAIAKEIVQQNPILDFKISPYLNDIIILVTAINEQLKTTESQAQAFKEVYVDVVMTVLLTALNEEKTYKALSTYGEDILCNGVQTATEYLELPPGQQTRIKLVKALCDATIAIEKGLAADSVVSKAITTIRNSAHPVITLNWNELINNLKELYVKLDKSYTYLFQFRSYNMDESTKRRVDSLFNDTKEFWFAEQHMERSLRLSVKLAFRFLDILDHGLFNVDGEFWLRIKYAITTTAGPISIFDETVRFVAALLKNVTYTTNLPPTTVKALSRIIPNIPQLTVDAVDIIARGETDVDPIISLLNSDLPWPCSKTSMSELLKLRPTSKDAVRGIETILCLSKEFRNQWVDYIAAKNASEIPSTWNTTDYQPRLFLKFSSTFDYLVEDILITRDSLEYIFSDSTDARLGLKEAWNYAVDALNTTQRDIVLRKFFTKVDTVLKAMNDSSIPSDVPMSSLWERYSKCVRVMDEDCTQLGRKAWKTFLGSLSIILENVATDLLTYFTEINEPNANILQVFGFTRRTGLYILYDKMPEFMGVLLNSYWDFGFMSQVRRASLSQFWDCEAVLSSMVIPEGSIIDATFMKKVAPFVCPSLLHWLSLPRGENTLLDVFSKPQYFFFTMPVENLTSRFENAYTKAVELTNYLTEISKNNQTLLTENDVKINTIEGKLEKIVDAVLSFKFNESSPSYRLFNEINMKQFVAHIYLARIVSIINKLSAEIHTLDIKNIYEGTDEQMKVATSDLNVIKYLFKRKPTDAINIHFDLLTDVIWTNNENYSIVDAFDKVCSNLHANISKTILVDDERATRQICSKIYRVIYGAAQHVAVEDYKSARKSLMNLVNTLKSDTYDATDVFEFLSSRKHLINNLRSSTRHSYDLSLPIYLKYLQSNLKSYNVVLSFLAGEDWWTLLRDLYNGPYATKFLGYLENSFEIAEDLLTNFDEIHIVRLLHDIDINQTESFCLPNITLSDYIPDRTGLWSDLKRQICTEDKLELYKELPPLLFASQGYENSLTLSKEIDYNAVDADISMIESRVDLIKDGPHQPQNPSWVTDEKIQHLRMVALQLLSKEILTKISFALLSNGVDAGTLFLNNSHCTVCSQFTTWFKQLNLQLYKKQEYDNLLCHLHSMSLDDVYHALKNDFHWDMAIRELISTRNYTKYEMNKSINEFVGQVKVYLLEDISAKSTKLTECLAKNVSRNEFGNATLFASVLAQTTNLIRAELPHIHEVEGVKQLQYLKELSTEVAHNIDVVKPLKDYLKEKNELHGELMKIVDDHDVVTDIENAQVNLRKIRSISESPDQNVIISNGDWTDICDRYNCSEIASVINYSLNQTSIGKMLPKYQNEEFWRFNFISSIIQHIGDFMTHGSRLLGLASKLDVPGVMDGRLVATMDALMLLLSDDALDNVMYSLQGVTSELRPLLRETPLERDLDALSSGLTVVTQLKTYMLEEVNLKVEVSKLFPDAEDVESGLSMLGINNTNFWSIAAPRIHAGHIQLKPLLSSKLDDSHLAKYVCQMEPMSKVLSPANLDVVSAEDVYGAVIEQFCGLPDETAKQVLPVLFRNFNFSFIVDKVGSTLLTKLYSASNLTDEEGSTVLSQFSQLAALFPMIQENMGNLGDTLTKEPLFQNLKNISSIGNLLSSPQFLASAGNMICGKPFLLNMPRMYKTITEAEDFATQPDQAQLDVLPTDFCRSMYKEIINVDGGKIVWSFVKPLIMGKILYTPPTPTVTRIIQQANLTYATMIKVAHLIHSFSASLPSVGKLSSHTQGIAVLRRMMTAPQFRTIRGMLLPGDSDIDMPDLNMDGLFEQFGDLEGVGGLLSKVSNLLQCINLNRFQPSQDEFQMTHEAAQLSMVNEFSAGVVFLNSEHFDESLTNVQYKIRMDIENVPTTNRLKDYLWIPGPESNFVENMRYFRGFVLIQDIVDKAIITLSHNHTRRKRDIEEKVDWAVYAQQTPYPCYRKDYFQTSVYESQTVIVAFFFSLLFTVASTVRFIVSDKETGNTMLMSVMGADLRWHTLSWFLACFAEMTITCICVTLILYLGRVLPHTDPSLVFTLVFLFGVSVLSFCYMLSKLFQSASLAAVFAAILYLISFMPFIIILSLEAVLYSSLKTFICLSMSSSLCYAFLYITRFEARGGGAQWGDVWLAPGDSEDMSIALAALMMCADAVLYFVIGWLIDRYYGIKTIKSNITHCTSTDEKAGVSIVNVTKVYGERSRKPKVALDNVSIELHKGQITTLLGHNGAGKTTLINILTGMLKPSKGHVIIRSEHAGTRLGVCPQRDVLLEYMSAREHVQLYAQLKSGRSAHEVQDEVERMLQVLSLGPVCSEPVSRLSGGTRRRLCVALAFIGSPLLVTLDEPTAGVDPAARRDIWTMIVKLKEDRTILLTTHHLDEAELLSDQIVIMHKGQIHTTGSPIEIKRTLGNGYKLTVMYPIRDPEHEETWEETSQEEKTKQLLTVVRDVVKNANVVDVNGLEVEIALPFFDANGLNNNFLQLCSVLEAMQTALGFKNYTLDCSSLEQVFFNICQQADTPLNGIEYVPEGTPSKSASSSSIRTDRAAQELVPPDGPLKGTTWEQFKALMHARYVHHTRNRWLLFMLIVLPALFITLAMGFSMLRPPADNEVALKLNDHLYAGSTEFLVRQPSTDSVDMDPSFAESVLQYLTMNKHTTDWTPAENPHCECGETSQHCDITANQSLFLPEMMLLPDADTLNQWLVETQEIYIEKRYSGYSSSLKNNLTNLIAWYNNKGHHALPATINSINNAILRTVANAPRANITTYTHPLKISKEQISKSTIYQHIADAGISSLILVSYNLVSAGAAIYLVRARCSQEKRLQLLCGVSPALYWGTALVWDMTIMAINISITAALMLAFGFPVFVARNNLPAICLLFVLYGYACGSLIHVAEKIFSDASIANMVLFCGNAFLGLSFMAVLLMFDVISESEATDNARWWLHKLFLVAPQFALGDGLLDIAKNTIQAQVLSRFGMDTYKDPLHSSLLSLHFTYLSVVGTLLLMLNLAIEYNCFDSLLTRFRPETIPPKMSGELEPVEVSAERKRVHATRALHDTRALHAPLRVNTIGNINRGFIHTEGKKNSMQRVVSPTADAAQCVELAKCYSGLAGRRVALRNLTLGIPPGQCTALLGQNGAGKSTTFSMLTGEVRPSSGQLYLNNELVNSTQLCTGLISYCPQSDAIDPLLTVTETLRFYCRLRGITEQEEVIKRTVAMFDLGKYADVRAGTLSGGNKRKLCTAIAFMARTSLVLLDEPTSGMDPVSRGCVARGVVSACMRLRGVLLSTHALDDARRLAARVALLRQGELVALASLDECLHRFGGGYVVQCRVPRSAPRAVWRRVAARAPAAQLRVLHQHTLHFLVPSQTTVDKKEVKTRLSDIFRLMAELQATCDIEDYTINQSSLEQMFLSFTDKSDIQADAVELEPLPSPKPVREDEELAVVTAL